MQSKSPLYPIAKLSLSLVERFDSRRLRKIVALADGFAAKQGRPGALMKQRGIYAHMIRPQAEGQSWSIS